MLQINKNLIRERLLRERDKLELLINRVGFARKLTLKGASENWSAKEVLALILAHEQFIADRLEEILHGDVYRPSETQTEFEAFLEKFGYPDFESPLLEENKSAEWILEKYKTIAFDEIVIQDIYALSAILSALERMPEERMIRFELAERVPLHTIRYYRHHTARISHWLKSLWVKQR